MAIQCGGNPEASFSASIIETPFSFGFESHLVPAGVPIHYIRYVRSVCERRQMTNRKWLGDLDV